MEGEPGLGEAVRGGAGAEAGVDKEVVVWRRDDSAVAAGAGAEDAEAGAWDSYGWVAATPGRSIVVGL